jgi:hypothetical protein
MGFQPDRRFESLRDAFAFITGEQVRRPVQQVWMESPSGLAAPYDLPTYLFRGECGVFETTRGSLFRPETYLLTNGEQLSLSDLKTLDQLVAALAWRFAQNEDYSLDEQRAWGLLQHYGIPTNIVDFTGSLDFAFAFAARGESEIGRIAVLKLPEAFAAARVINFTGHPWAERAQRQAAYGVVPSGELTDLKSDIARFRFPLSWYEFPVSPADREYFREKCIELLRWTDDPSAGFLRFHITEFVEARGKFSVDLTEWLLDRVPIAPYCYLAKSFEGKDVVVNFRSAKDLPHYDQAAEREHSQCYWSSAHPEHSSGTALKQFSWKPVGEITYDPRTFHAGRSLDG